MRPLRYLLCSQAALWWQPSWILFSTTPKHKLGRAAHMHFSHTHYWILQMSKRWQFGLERNVRNHRPAPVIEAVPGRRRRWKLPESESLVWNIVRSIALAVRAFQLAHGDWRRRGVRCDEAGGRAISPGWYCDGTPLAPTHMYSYQATSEGTPANVERGVAERRAARTQPTIQLNQLFVRLNLILYRRHVTTFLWNIQLLFIHIESWKPMNCSKRIIKCWYTMNEIGKYSK